MNIKSITAALTLLIASASFASAGEWTKKAYTVDGTWNIEGTTLSLDEDFDTRRGPDLKIFLSPLPIGELTGKNATEGSILVAVLEDNEGAQSYELPEGIDLSDYQSIIIHCERYSKLWGAAALND